MREKIADYYEQKSRSGKKGARVTWGKTEDSDDAEDLVEEAAESSKL